MGIYPLDLVNRQIAMCYPELPIKATIGVIFVPLLLVSCFPETPKFWATSKNSFWLLMLAICLLYVHKLQLTTYNPGPIGSMYGIYANIWGILMVNVIIYGIHTDPMGEGCNNQPRDLRVFGVPDVRANLSTISSWIRGQTALEVCNKPHFFVQLDPFTSIYIHLHPFTIRIH